MTPLVFEFPLPPNLANDRKHWRTKHRERKQYLEACDILQAAKFFPAPPATPLSPVTLTFTLVMSRRMDDDNALARVKWPVDWLRTRGYIVDDRQPHCRMTIPEQRITQKLSPRAELTVCSSSPPE